MGTSTGYDAPTTPQWSNVKREVTQASRDGTPLPETAQTLVRDHILANGGAREIVRSGGVIGGGRAPQQVAQRLAHLVSAVGSVGLTETLRELGLEFLVGRSVNDIRLYLLDNLGGEASTLDDVDARNALSRILDDRLRNANTPEEVERILVEQSSAEALECLLSEFFGYYLYEQFCRVYYERLITRVGEAQANAFLNGILDYIKSALNRMARNRPIARVDWMGAEGRAVADEILRETLEVYGG